MMTMTMTIWWWWGAQWWEWQKCIVATAVTELHGADRKREGHIRVKVRHNFHTFDNDDNTNNDDDADRIGPEGWKQNSILRIKWLRAFLRCQIRLCCIIKGWTFFNFTEYLLAHWTLFRSKSFQKYSALGQIQGCVCFMSVRAVLGTRITNFLPNDSFVFVFLSRQIFCVCVFFWQIFCVCVHSQVCSHIECQGRAGDVLCLLQTS